MTYRKYFDSDDPNGPQQFFDAIAGQAASRTMGRDEKGAFVEYSVGDEGAIAQIRQAFADYVASEGCSCCQNTPKHENAAARLAGLLNVPKYDDGSGFDFYRFKSGATSDSGFIDIGRLPVLPLAVALVAGYAIHFMAMHGIFQALSALGVR